MFVNVEEISRMVIASTALVDDDLVFSEQTDQHFALLKSNFPECRIPKLHIAQVALFKTALHKTEARKV